MKITKIVPWVVLVCCCISSPVQASESFEAPVAPDGEVVPSRESGTVTIQYTGTSIEQLKQFYQTELENEPDINWKESKDEKAIVIHDWGNRQWHKIQLHDRGSGQGVEVTIYKDSWTWIVGTLVIRFVGVAVVLIILMVALMISGKLMSAGLADKKKAEANS